MRQFATDLNVPEPEGSRIRTRLARSRRAGLGTLLLEVLLLLAFVVTSSLLRP